MPDAPKAFGTVKETATLLGVGLATVYDLCASGKLAHYKVGRTIRIKDADLEVYLASARREVVPPETRPTKPAARRGLPPSADGRSSLRLADALRPRPDGRKPG